MYKRILVPIDGSDTARLGLQEALRLASTLKAQLMVIHVVDDSVAASPYVYGAVFQQVQEQLRASGEAVIAEARTLASKADVPTEAKLVEASGIHAGEHVIQAAKRWGADLIVCGTHGRRGVRRIVMGSDAEYIVRRTPVPILLVRAPDSHEH